MSPCTKRLQSTATWYYVIASSVRRPAPTAPAARGVAAAVPWGTANLFREST